MIIEILVSVVAGLAAHQTISITARMPDGWRNIVEHAIGVTGAYPVFLLFRRRLGNGRDRSDAAYWLAFLWFGMGVALGWLVDTFNQRKE
jgi:hypothetical protein